MTLTPTQARAGTWVLGVDYLGDPPYVLPPDVPRDRLRELLTGPRQESRRVEALTRTDAPLGLLDGIRVGGDVQQSIHQAIRGTGNLTHVREPAEAGPPWTQRRLQPWYELRDPESGEVYEWPLGVFIPATPREDHTDDAVTTDVVLYDKLLLLDRDKVGATWGYDTGTNPITAVGDLIASTGETAMALTETTKTLAVPMTWDPGTPKLRIVNDLLDAANYFSLVVDGRGQFRAAPYVAPQDRPVRWDFRDDHESIYVPEWTHEADDFDVPNHVVIVGRSEADSPPMVANAYRYDGEYGIDARGVVTHHESDSDATDQATLDAIAQRRLTELMQVTSTFEIEHAYLPGLALNDAVILASERHGTDVLCVVQAMTVPLTTGGLVRTTLREVTG